jgi:hypothetical protein
MFELNAVHVPVHQTEKKETYPTKVQTQIIDCGSLPITENKEVKCDICVNQRTT